MPARPRKDIIDPDVPGFYHCTSRCVRRAFLCGQDEYTGRNYEHGKEWLEFRLSFLASQMSIEVVGTAMMDNHHHAILRNRPDIAKTWSAREIARDDGEPVALVNAYFLPNRRCRSHDREQRLAPYRIVRPEPSYL